MNKSVALAPFVEVKQRFARKDFLIMGDVISILKIFSHTVSDFLKSDNHVTVRIDIVCG